MGIFHCPLGCAYYEDEPCIDCRLCLATNEEERVLASRGIRDYLRAHAETRNGPSRKIAVCGKGGTGKTTAVALMAGAFRELGYSVLVLDLDESNPGLRRMLGLAREPKPLLAVAESLPQGEKAKEGWFAREEMRIRDIPDDYLEGEDGLKFLMAGKIVDPFQGCACSLADLARDFVQKLILEEREILLIDTEAGVESFGRGVERAADTVVIMVEPSAESLALAEKIGYMADGIGVKKVRGIANKIPSEKIGQRVTEEMAKRNIKVLGTLWVDDRISEASLEGIGPSPQSDARTAVKGIVQRLLDESE
jgi:CO dehydrogenase maturation factor